MGIQVKICGITTEAALEIAIGTGADFVGLVFFPRSPRHLDFVRAAELSNAARGRIKIVALTVDASDIQLGVIVNAVQPDYLQLHGDETVDRVAGVRHLAGLPVIKAIKVGTRDDVIAARSFEDVADILLFDARVAPSANALPGGNGEAFDWTYLRGAGLRPNYMLSGGLNPDNVTSAIAISGANAVDVSSGVEDAPGRKNTGLIRRFIAAAKSQNPALLHAAAE